MNFHTAKMRTKKTFVLQNLCNMLQYSHIVLFN